MKDNSIICEFNSYCVSVNINHSPIVAAATTPSEVTFVHYCDSQLNSEKGRDCKGYDSAEASIISLSHW